MPERTPSTNSRGKKTDYFQRRKVGSIRDNPKLMKIRQQFENASKTNEEQENRSFNNSFSASLSRDPNENVLGALLKFDSKLCDQSVPYDKNLKTKSRRHSEGEVTVQNSLSVYQKESASFHGFQSQPAELRTSSSSSRTLNYPTDASNPYGTLLSRFKDVHSSNYHETETKIETSFQSVNSPSETKTSGENMCNRASVIPNAVSNPAPPIPKGGISPATQNSLYSHGSSSKRYSLSLYETSIGKNTKKPVVKSAIELYEGMSTHSPKRNKVIKSYGRLLKREDSTSRKSQSNRRSSFRKSKSVNDCVPSSTRQKETVDTDDCSQNVYQTLSSTTLLPGLHDPYDRLNRIHDVVNHIHKGQTSACAACKAIPSSVLQLPDDVILEVKCNEIAPHHHPPCICFSCQHSKFSCTSRSEDDGLYYNVCCLHPPNRETWRQSRRRPVCEQNGRLCIVNCDMEKDTKTEKSYENLAECLSSSMLQKDKEKLVSGDSCESDEGWVDVSDSEDERTLVNNEINLSSNFCCERVEERLNEHSSYDLDEIVLACNNLDLSKSFSTEHLYESISELDSDEQGSTKLNELDNTKNSSSFSLMSDAQPPENEPDSGEWSTESSSPVFNESSSVVDRSKASSGQYRFSVGHENQTAAKKTFMNSVLGKKDTHTKKRRMSNFFVPWLASNNEYGSTESKAQKGHSKKQRNPSQGTLPKQSAVISKNNMTDFQKLNTITKGAVSPTEVPSRDLSVESETVVKCLFENNFSSPESTPSLSSRDSLQSGAYLRMDQLQSNEIPRRKASVTCDGATDVSVERIYGRSSSGNSEHSYIHFTPIKEEQVPLYQFYERNIKERVSICRSAKSLSPIMWNKIPENAACNESKTPQLSVVEQLSPDAADMKMLWCELPEVKESSILERISAQDLKLQEAIFEFIQSQASFIRSLKVLYENFIDTPEFSDIESSSCVLSKHEQDALFFDILLVKDVSERILHEITTRWKDSILIPDICDIILHHAQQPAFSAYIKYCTNRVYQERTLKELKESRLCFLEALRKLESNPICQGLSLESFLFLPMQHIARLPLLLDNIFRWLVPESPSYDVCKAALEAVHRIFMNCNESARKMERLEEMLVLNKQLEFKECKVIPLISASRWLLKKGELMKLEFDKKTFGRSNRCVRIPVYLFLFNDLLIFTKRKNDDCYIVVDYCSRDRVQATAINAKDLQQPLISPNICRYLIYLKLLSNHQGTPADMIFNCTLLSERTRWIEAIHSENQSKPCEVWEYDCPQVQCFKNYIAQQPDELSLQESDVVTIHRKMNDGWYEGRRLRDGLQGWFPASYTMDIPCSRARASNLRQCYRLLMLSHHK